MCLLVGEQEHVTYVLVGEKEHVFVAEPELSRQVSESVLVI